MASSIHNANSTIDDLTLALADFSRVPSPEPTRHLLCCCGKEDCQNATTWAELKTRLESRLILSAEVGQALLQRHEAYVREHERREAPPTSDTSNPRDEDDESISDPSAAEISELVKEKARLEKVLHLTLRLAISNLEVQCLNQALVNNEVGEASTKTIMQELNQARETISRLTAQHARSVGWEARLSTAIREKDDMQQERDGESNRAKLAEFRLASMKDKAAKLQRDVKRLQETLEERRLHRMESSENLLHDARLRLETLQGSQLGQTALVEQTELTTVLESLVSDNEILKRDNAELQSMLTESREELHTLHEEIEEHRAKPPSIISRAPTPQKRHPFVSSSVPASVGKDNSFHLFNPRSSSVDRKNPRHFEPLTPETSRLPLSPTESFAPSETKWLSISQPRPRYPSSNISIEVEESCDENDADRQSPEKRKTRKTILLLTRSRAVQTENWPQLLSPSPLPSYMSATSPYDPRSESSSFSDTHSSHLSTLLDRFSGLHTRMSQADALTLTNRLKRQHLKGADIGHLSRSTINNIIYETTTLRTQYRFLLEDDSVAIPCTRRDFRSLFKLFKEIYTDMGEMRVLLNDIIIDPTCASKVSEQALNPSIAEEDAKSKGEESAGSSAGSGWISKLFSPGRADSSGERLRLNRYVNGRTPSTRPRFIPKLGPALSASATTVNVEFSGIAAGRSTTSTVASQVKSGDGEALGPSASSHSASAVMNIFAGAPQHVTDPWVVVSKGPRRVPSFVKDQVPVAEFSGGTLGRSAGRRNGNAISRDVDAVIDVQTPLRADDETADDLAPLLQRTLRRRGLSDSSIHSTFTSHAEDVPPAPSINIGTPAWPIRPSVFETLSRTVQSIRGTASGGSGIIDAPAVSPPQQVHESVVELPRSSTPGPLRNFLPNLTSWAAAGNLLEPLPDASFSVGSVRDESFMVTRTRRPGEPHTMDYF
ncbi:hypothetical protein H0H87_011099 [Tephrocybe sp. NHM501043]|nr:hypothetical protein H0H87_011099 [Tephrocybe sp. NHM501043]